MSHASTLRPPGTWSYFCLIILLAAVLRFAGISFESLWLDEGYQSLVGAYAHGLPDFLSTATEPSLFRFAAPGSQADLFDHFREVDPLCPPLYTLLLNFWLHNIGQDDTAIRSLSALLSVLSIIALFYFCRSLLGERAALATAFLQAISPFDIHYAQEARMYSLVLLCAVLSAGSLASFILQASKRAILLLVLYVLSTWALINSHYTALFLLAAEIGVASLFLAWKKDWQKFACLIFSWLGIALLWIPWFPLFTKAAALRKESFYVARTSTWYWPLYALFIRQPINWEIFLSGQRVVAYAIPIYLTSASMLIAACHYLFKNKSTNKPAYYAFVAWALVPTSGLWLIDVMENHRVVEVARYLIYTAPAIYALAGVGLVRIIETFSWGKWLLAAHCFFACLNIVYAHNVHQKEPWRELAAAVKLECPVDKLIVVSQFYDIALLDRYLESPYKQLGLSPSMGKKEIESKLSKVDSFALITAQDGEAIKEMLPERFVLGKEINLSHGLHFRLYKAEP
ncbi:MAG: glycosyltransferase family 39 protein [Candidatus Obscuribacterales bacterium]|nr:glycosyltransferase family 39 protein [Candidatus Obscuribacterales bacterium]